MRKMIMFAVYFLIAAAGYAQIPNLDRLMTEKKPQCEDIRYNCIRLIPEYFAQRQYDSALLIAEYWIEKCGRTEESYRAKILLSLFVGKDISEDFQYLGDYIIQPYYYNVPLFYGGSPYYRPWYYNMPQVHAEDFNIFLVELAHKVSVKTDSETLEGLVARYYTGESYPLYSALKNKHLQGTLLQQQYDATVAEAYAKSDLNMSGCIGLWIPSDKASLLGTHPEIGIQMGMKHRKVLYDITIAFRFGNSPNLYQVYDQKQDSLFTTDKFFGGYVGFDLGYELFKNMKHEIDLLSGIGYDGFTAVNAEEDDDIESVGVGSLNLNLGLGYRYYYDLVHYFGVRARYNVVNYNTHGGTDLAGNAITIRLFWGFSGNSLKQHTLKQLGYYQK